MRNRHRIRKALTFCISLGCMTAASPAVHAQIASGPPAATHSVTAEDLAGLFTDRPHDQYPDVADAFVLFQRGNGPAALSMLQGAKKKHPELPPGEVMFAHLCFASGNVKAGRDILQSAVIAAKEDPEAWNMLGDLQLRENHLAEAELLFEKALDTAERFRGSSPRRTRQTIQARTGAAISNERRGLWNKAEPHLRAWLELDPQSGEAHSRLAATLVHTQRFDDARAVLERLRELDPRQLPAEVAMGNIYGRVGQPEKAEASMTAAIQKYPTDFDTRVAVAHWSIGAGKFESALNHADEAAKLNPQSPLPILLAAQVAYLNGRHAEAETGFRKVYHSHPANFDATNGLALSILAQEDSAKYPQALQYATVNARANDDLRSPRGQQSAATLARAFYRNDRLDEAAALMQRVLASGPITPETSYFAAIISADKNNPVLARELLEKSLESKTVFAYRTEAQALLESLAKQELAEKLAPTSGISR